MNALILNIGQDILKEKMPQKIQMEFEQIVSALEFKLQPKVFVEYF